MVDKRRLAVFDSDSIFRILYVRHRDWASTIELWRHHGFTCIIAQLVKRRLYWFSLAAKRSKGKLIRSRQAERQLKTWATTTKADLEPFSEAQVLGYERWRKCWVKIPLCARAGPSNIGCLQPDESATNTSKKV